ncbi:hypothetical protein L218DRAFT_948282 [Marasmius fiardii PR-910]|nr:hypothetical protein L218DRAFT_948282 [Marasmius fiardii PR-910]
MRHWFVNGSTSSTPWFLPDEVDGWDKGCLEMIWEEFNGGLIKESLTLDLDGREEKMMGNLIEKKASGVVELRGESTNSVLDGMLAEKWWQKFDVEGLQGGRTVEVFKWMGKNGYLVFCKDVFEFWHRRCEEGEKGGREFHKWSVVGLMYDGVSGSIPGKSGVFEDCKDGGDTIDVLFYMGRNRDNGNEYGGDGSESTGRHYGSSNPFAIIVGLKESDPSKNEPECNWQCCLGMLEGLQLPLESEDPGLVNGEDLCVFGIPYLCGHMPGVVGLIFPTSELLEVFYFKQKRLWFKKYEAEMLNIEGDIQW